MHLPAFALSFSLAFAVQTVTSSTISKICFTRGDFIYLKDLKTGLLKRVVKGSYPSLSPDGKTLAFSTDDTTKTPPIKIMSREIKLIDLESNKVTSFDSLKNFLCYGATWSPDGSKLAFGILKDKRWDIGVLDPATREWRMLTDKLATNVVGYSLNSWTADSQYIICQDLDNVFQVNLEGKLLKKIAAADLVDDVSYISSLTRFSMSGDGRALLFDTGDQPDDPRLPMIWLYDLEKKTRVRVTPKTLAGYNPQWLPSGDEIIFTGWTRDRRSVPGIYRIRKDGTRLELLVPNGESATFAVSR